jgi:hypothetical protein
MHVIRPRSRAPRLAAALLVALLVSACVPSFGSGAAEDGGAATEDVTEDVAQTDGDAVDDAPDASEPEADDGGQSDAADGEQPTSGPGSLDGEPLATVTNAAGTVLSVTRLDRVGELVVLGYDIDNTSGDADLAMRFAWARESGFRANELDRPYLLDEVQLVRYRVLRDSDGECLCDDVSIGGGVDVGEARSFASTHPAPPPGVGTVSVVFPDFPPLPDIPISGS